MVLLQILMEWQAYQQRQQDRYFYKLGMPPELVTHAVGSPLSHRLGS
jgi:hypothetical protein